MTKLTTAALLPSLIPKISIEVQENKEEELFEVNHVTDFPSITVSANIKTTGSHLGSNIVKIDTTFSEDTIVTQLQHNMVENTTDVAKIVVVGNENHQKHIKIDGSNSNEKVNGNNIKNNQENTELPNTQDSKVLESLNTRELTNSNSVTLKNPDKIGGA